MQPMPSPMSTSDAPALLRTTPCVRRKSATRACPGCFGNRLPSARNRVVALRPIRRVPGNTSPIPTRHPAILQPRGSQGAAAPSCVRQFRSMPAASHISKGPSSQLKPARIASINRRRIASRLANAVRGKVPKRRKKRPEKSRCLIFGRIVGQQQPQPLLHRRPHSSPSPARAEPPWQVA